MIDKKKWTTPKYMVEFFVPNNYIAGCNASHYDTVTITHSEYIAPNWNFWMDANGDSQIQQHEIINAEGADVTSDHYYVALHIDSHSTHANVVSDKPYYLVRQGHDHANTYYVGDTITYNAS